MTLKLELSDEQVASLKAKAAAQGLTLEEWLRKIAAVHASPGQTGVRKGRYSLSELVEQCDINAPLSAEDRAWLDAPTFGREV